MLEGEPQIGKPKELIWDDLQNFISKSDQFTEWEKTFMQQNADLVTPGLSEIYRLVQDKSSELPSKLKNFRKFLRIQSRKSTRSMADNL
jgi:hypothetical protein